MNTQSLLFVVLCLLFAADVNAQELFRITRGCHYDGDDTAREVYTYPPSQEMQKILQRISAAMGLESNFILKSANVTNALATTERGQRYILYSTTFLENFKREARTQWAAYSVLAHEIGHHLNYDDFGETDSQRRKKMELAADRFAGNILQKMGATLEEAQAGINSFSLPHETATHPPKSARLEAVASGWKQAQEGIVLQMGTVDKDKLAQEWFGKGYKAYENKEYEKAIADCTEAIRLKPDYAEAFNCRGGAKHYLGKYAEAIGDYDQAIRLKPDHAEAFYNRGLAKNKLGKYTEAIADHDQAIRLKPDNPDAFLDRGFAKKNLGKYTEAIADYDQVIRLKPDADAFNNRGVAKKNLGKYPEAIADYDQAIRLDPNHARAYANKGCAIVAMNDKSRLGEAIDLINKALGMDSSLSYAKDCKNTALEKLKE